MMGIQDLLTTFMEQWHVLNALAMICLITFVWVSIIAAKSTTKSCDWWEKLKLANHANLIIPSNCFSNRKGSQKLSLAKRARHVFHNIYERDVLNRGIFIIENLPPTSTPLLCFVNSKSGGKQGKLVMKLLQEQLNPVQVVDLSKHDPLKALKAFTVLPNLRILAAGGDGTVRWILDTISKLPADTIKPPVAILPLGTGNDLSRVLGWGVTTLPTEEYLTTVLEHVCASSIEMLDIWKVTITNTHNSKSGVNHNKTDSKTKVLMFNNYFGIGVDAQIVLQFHEARQNSPEHFMSQIGNKLWYGIFGWNEIWKASQAGLRQHVRLLADDVVVELPGTLEDDLEGIVFSNISSYGGGSRLWSSGSQSGEYDAAHAGLCLSSRSTSLEENEEMHDSARHSMVSCGGMSLDGGGGSSALQYTSDSLSGSAGVNHFITSSSSSSHNTNSTSNRVRNSSYDSTTPNDRRNSQASDDADDSNNLHASMSLSNIFAEAQQSSPSSYSLVNSSALSPSGKPWCADAPSDGLLECVCVHGSLHLAQIKAGICSSIKVAQASRYELTVDRCCPMQSDGEPWVEKQCHVVIERSEQAKMLQSPSDLSSILSTGFQFGSC